MFEGVGVLLGRVFSENTRPQLPPRTSHYRLNFDLTSVSIPRYHSTSCSQLSYFVQYPKTCNPSHLRRTESYTLYFYPRSTLPRRVSYSFSVTSPIHVSPSRTHRTRHVYCFTHPVFNSRSPAVYIPPQLFWVRHRVIKCLDTPVLWTDIASRVILSS